MFIGIMLVTLLFYVFTFRFLPASSSVYRYFITCLASCRPKQVALWSINGYTHPFNGPTRVSRYQKGNTNMDFTEARGSEWQWHQLGRMLVCISLQIDNHASTLPVRFLQAGCPSCRPTNSVKALKANLSTVIKATFDLMSRAQRWTRVCRR